MADPKRRPAEHYIDRIYTAQTINRMMGGMAVMPWELGDFPVDWMDAIITLSTGGQKITAWRGAVESAKQRAIDAIKRRNNGR